jgi:SAM-dependent methyltransferase
MLFLTNRLTPAILFVEVTMTIQCGYDPKVLRQDAYADDTHLDVRCRTHKLYTLNPVDFGQWTLERLQWRGDERVLDVGCGPGDLLRKMAHLRLEAGQRAGRGVLLGFDFSPGMVAKAVESATGLPVHYFVADAQHLPFSDRAFDVVLACHMLYHVPDVGQAVAEAARVLQPGGYFLAVTNSAHTMPEFHALCGKAATRFAVVARPDTITDRFSLENGVAFCEPHFHQVEMHTLPGTLRFPTAQPFIDYFASSRALIMHPDHTDAEWLAVLDFVRSETEAVITDRGYFDVTKTAGAIVGVKGD